MWLLYFVLWILILILARGRWALPSALLLFSLMKAAACGVSCAITHDRGNKAKGKAASAKTPTRNSK